jgi:hypothetical protein
MNRPAEICAECYEAGRIFDAGSGCDIAAVYCRHSKTGAHAITSKGQATAWQVHALGEGTFWECMDVVARFSRGEISETQAALVMAKWAMQHHRRNSLRA